MKIVITVVRNGLLLELEPMPSSDDPLAHRGDARGGTWFCRDTTDLMGRIAQRVKGHFDPIVDRLDQD